MIRGNSRIQRILKPSLMINIIRTDSANPDFIQLIKYLDADLAKRDGDDHSFYAQYNKIDKIKHTVVLYEDGKAIACGAIKEFNPTTMEVKRMYTLPESRGKGIASTILKELETWAAEMKYEKCVLETGKKQPEAVELYKKNDYNRIPNYGQYAGIENSLCFEKKLN
jgi:GNAT superfamily N-acetyltransferase